MLCRSQIQGFDDRIVCRIFDCGVIPWGPLDGEDAEVSRKCQDQLRVRRVCLLLIPEEDGTVLDT